MYWLPDGVAVGVHEVRVLVPRCKSSINGSLHRLGYTLSIGRLECAVMLTRIFPLLRDQTAELRKWSIRRVEAQRPSMVLPIFSAARPDGPPGREDAFAFCEPDEIEPAKWDEHAAFGSFLARIDQREFKLR
jgi:hypothetical protein